MSDVRTVNQPDTVRTSVDTIPQPIDFQLAEGVGFSASKCDTLKISRGVVWDTSKVMLRGVPIFKS